MSIGKAGARLAGILAIRYLGEMTILWSTAALLTPLSLAACGPNTLLLNDTTANIYADFITPKYSRTPSPQEIVPGSSLNGPWPPKEAGTLYVGNDPTKLRQFAVAGLCDIKKRNCVIRVSRLPG
jgi:hypothetical protein